MRRPALLLGTGTSFLLAALLLGVLVGPVAMPPLGVARAVATHLPFLHLHGQLTPMQETILWQLRAPRVVLGALVGGMLAVSGAAYQGVFRNPLADPYLLGVAAGAGLGATIAIVARAGGSHDAALLPACAFAGALVAVGAAWLLAATDRGGHVTALVLAGVTVASFLTAVQTFVQQQHAETLQAVYAWILGRLDAAGWGAVAMLAPYVLASTVVLLLLGRSLDVLGVGDEEATSLGMHVGRVRIVVVVAATIGVAAAVATSGLIGFVGIIVPHAVRRIAGTGHRLVLPLSLLVGGGFLVLADVVARTALAPAELPIGVVTAAIGAPCFALVLRSTQGSR